MLTLLGGLLVLAALLLLLPALLLFTQVVLACLPAPVRVARQGKRARVAVLVPAHNEATLIASTLASIRPQLREGDQLLVVADNCTDQTASLARAAGAQVVERQDQQRRGKGYALDFGVQHLRQSPPDVLIIIDADCQVGADVLEQLARCCVDSGRPAQALYLMHAPAGAGLKVQVAAFAWRVKNLVRPRGWARAGLPCQLMGAGMAFTWQDLSAVNLATGHLVEDLKLGLECAALGKPPLFCPEAVVNSHFPTSQEGLSIQRKRWEHGHLGVVLAEGPKLVGHALARRNWPLLGMALDLLVPPLALLSLLLTVLFLVTWLAFGLFGLLLPALLATLGLGLLGAAVLLAWARFAREVMPFSVLMYAPFYAARKIPLYLGFLLKRQVDWVRSKRDDS
ncbi:glycosyltransferase family 2 protein [Pseudomonas putida]|uniref:glycosyltransferase family 2 protein n=1 Tax=Pseudomonas putida TaxID=303 RepID=UPI0009A179A3|nr:glycosyltransferase family 2 protein [Pseudomonas putida]